MKCMYIGTATMEFLASLDCAFCAPVALRVVRAASDMFDVMGLAPGGEWASKLGAIVCLDF